MRPADSYSMVEYPILGQFCTYFINLSFFYLKTNNLKCWFCSFLRSHVISGHCTRNNVCRLIKFERKKLLRYAIRETYCIYLIVLMFNSVKNEINMQSSNSSWDRLCSHYTCTFGKVMNVSLPKVWVKQQGGLVLLCSLPREAN